MQGKRRLIHLTGSSPGRQKSVHHVTGFIDNTGISLVFSSPGGYSL
uniref:Uncharacterized protein n=1 Tax=Anguilla anguilla TaxID=7936 RepID=A0A0E9R8R8_ANGAN